MNTTITPIDLSVVVPAHNEQENLPELYKSLKPILTGLAQSWEIIFVDDGSHDGTWDAIKGLNTSEKGKVTGLRFSRNFGHQSALMAGLSRARGKAVITMDADFQHPPDVIPTLVAEWKKGYELVHTIREDSTGNGFFKKIATRIFYNLYSALSGLKMEYGMADFRLVDRKVLQEVLKFGEDGIFLRGLFQWVGYKSCRVRYKSGKRLLGKPQFTFMKLCKLSYAGITAFSIAPLRAAFLIGGLTVLLSLSSLFYAAMSGNAGDLRDNSVQVIISAVGLFFGITFILMGILGEYIGRVLAETRSRPRFIISEETA